MRDMLTAKYVAEAAGAPHSPKGSQVERRGQYGPLGRHVRQTSQLVKGQNNIITGIVTASDLNDQFLQLAEPFLPVGEIESHIRRVIHGQFTREELADIPKASDEQTIDHIANLTFGDYCRLLEDPTKWEKLSLKFERTVFVNSCMKSGTYETM